MEECSSPMDNEKKKRRGGTQYVCISAAWHQEGHQADETSHQNFLFQANQVYLEKMAIKMMCAYLCMFFYCSVVGWSVSQLVRLKGK